MKHWLALPLLFTVIFSLRAAGQSPESPAENPPPAITPAPAQSPAPATTPQNLPVPAPVPPPSAPIPGPGISSPTETPAPPAEAAPAQPAQLPGAVKPPPPAAAGEGATIKQANVNVRGQARIHSEVVARLNKGDKVSVLDEVTVNEPKTDEPPHWLKIALPSNTDVWVHSSFLDPATKTVTANRLNVRSGPGENYSVLGQIEKGTVVKELAATNSWTRIEPTPGLYAFVAAHLVDRPGVKPVELATTRPPTPAVTPAGTDQKPLVQPSEGPVITAGTTTTAVPTNTPQVQVNEPPAAVAEPIATITETPAEQEPPRRVVTREGIVRRSVSIQAPTYFVLESKDNRKVINYLYSPPSRNLALRDYQGQRILVSGEELLDERWPNTPVITVETLRTMP